MMNVVDPLILEQLRECQKQGITTISDYLSSESSGSCLVSLPTGAGKSGVICTIGHYCTYSKILVVTHRRAVCDQLYKQLKGKFFDKILPDVESSKFLRKKVFNQINDTEEDGIYCTTFQKIIRLSEAEINGLSEIFGLILIDEGHAEPSPKWGAAIRELDAKKVIITATPYRNDLFSFDIDVDHSYVYTYKNALEERIIVSPTFETIEDSILIDKINRLKEIHPDAVCIVKCKNFIDIKKYLALLSAKFRTLAMHVQFEDNAVDGGIHYVPADIERQNYEVLIHQKMLDEGIDIPQAKILVLTYSVGSGKELVQTIGRIVRLYEDYAPYVFELEGDSNYRLWSNYLEFDEYISNPQSAVRFLNTLNTATLIDSYLDAFPLHSYYESCYRKKFSFNEFDPLVSLEIPLASVCFYYKLNGFSLNDCLDKLHWEFNRNGALTKYNTEIGVITSVCFNNSRFLKDSLFFEPSLEIMVVKDFDDIVAVFDSQGRRFNGRDDLKIGRAIELEKLYKVVARTDKTKTKQANTRALHRSDHRAESVAFKGENLEQINHPQSNSGYAITTAIVSNLGENNTTVSSYYLGVASGRICDQKQTRFDYQKFCSWIEDIKNSLDSDRKTTSIFLNSFASEIDDPPTNDPVACIVDFTIVSGNIEILFNGHKKQLENTFIFKKYKNGLSFFDVKKIFNLTFIASEPFLFSACPKNSALVDKVVFYFENNELKAQCDDLTSFFVDDVCVDVNSLFNSSTIKLIYGNGVSFLDGNFYKYTLPAESGKLNQNLMKSIIPIPELLAQGLSEKNENGLTSTNFGQNSVFALIDSISNVHKQNPTLSELGVFFEHIPNVDLVLCADMGTESADFIISSEDKLVFVHVKCGKSSIRPQSSAGAIFEVGSQALKNLQSQISADRTFNFANLTVLNNPWPRASGNNSHICLNSRVRLFNKSFDQATTVNEVLEKINDRRINPLVKKEIWLVVGNSFSRQHFISQFSNPSTAAAESIQAYQLLDTWLSQASNHNVDMKVFVSP